MKASAHLIATLLILMADKSVASPHDTYNKPVSISQWGDHCRYALEKTNEMDFGRGVSHGICIGVIRAYSNELRDWCVPHDVTWGEYEQHHMNTAAGAKFPPLSTRKISDFIDSVNELRWPCT
jgi:hypothetical protein